MKNLFIALCILFSFNGLAQETDSLLLMLGPSSGTNLLPQKLSPVKKAFWGEKGLLRITGIAPLTPEHREKELRQRRRMLIAHQIMGFVTLGGLLVTDFAGQMTLSGHEQYRRVHNVAVASTLGTYTITALLALLAPPPMVTRSGWSNIKTHKLLAYIHFAGMILTPLLAPHFTGTVTQQARFHQISGYATTAVFGAAIIAIKFK